MDEESPWGLDSLKASDQQLVDDDSILLLRQMVITHLAALGRRHRGLPDPWNFLEHPVDPKHNSRAPSAWRCSSIWATRALRTWHHLMGNTFLTFDQCRLGQVVKKTTTLTTNLHLRHWEGMACNHSPEARKQSESLSSADLSRYPWPMMQGLAAAIHEHSQETSSLRSSQQPCSAAASGADHGPGASKKARLGLSPAERTSHSPGGTLLSEGTSYTSTPPTSRTAKTQTEGMNPVEGKTPESQALETKVGGTAPKLCQRYVPGDGLETETGWRNPSTSYEQLTKIALRLRLVPGGNKWEHTSTHCRSWLDLGRKPSTGRGNT